MLMEVQSESLELVGINLIQELEGCCWSSRLVQLR